jgi:hypothetical protein
MRLVRTAFLFSAFTLCASGLAAQPVPTAVQQAYLKASNTDAGDWFGLPVAVSGNTVVVGAPVEASGATGVNGNQSDNSASAAGAAYVFVRNGSSWTQQAYLKASNTNAHDVFGWSVAISGDTIVVGAQGEASNATGVNGNQANNSASNAGAAYVFVRNGTTWTQQAYLKASDTGSGASFGESVAVSGDTIVVGAPFEVGQNIISGAAYVFERVGTNWFPAALLKASNPDQGDEFGWSVAVAGNTVAVGAWLESSDATGINGDQSNNFAQYAGAAYVFVGSNGGFTWNQQAYVKASNTATDDGFGYAVSLSGDTLLVSSPGFGFGTGLAYVFTRAGTVWSQQAFLGASNPDALDNFGYSVAISGDEALIGAYREDSSGVGVNGNQSNNLSTDSGAAYVFVRNGTSWSQADYLKASNTDSSDNFAFFVALDSDTAVVGAYAEGSNATGVNGNQADNSAAESGAAYVFDLGLDPWTDLGHGLAGSHGIPYLAGTGTLVGGTFVTTTVTHLDPGNMATDYIGLSAMNAPFKGGVFVPSPNLVIGPLPTTLTGTIDLPSTWPTGVPSGFSFYEQWWLHDSTAVHGFAASNAIRGTTP